MSETGKLAEARAPDTPNAADMRDAATDSEHMYPLLRAPEVARILGFSPAWVHQQWDARRLPYVEWECTRGEDGLTSRNRNRRMRSDHLAEEVRRRTHAPVARADAPWKEPLTDEEWANLGVSMDLATFCRVAQMSESSVRRAIDSGQFEELGIRARRLNSKYRFSVKEVLAAFPRP